MDTVAAIAAVVVGVAFLVAGGSKIVARDAWPAQARELGAPAIVIPVVPWVEIALGALAVAQLWLPVVGVVAALMLVAFTVLIVVRLSQGKRPACACFGAWSASPIGAGHVVRNMVLLVLAMTAALFG